MSQQFRCRLRIPIALLSLACSVSLLSAAANATSTQKGGDVTAVGSTSGAGSAQGEPATFRSISVKGGYVAAGVGLRNRGIGTITVSGVPSGAKVHAAYLFWSVLGERQEQPSYGRGAMGGRSLSGTRIGSGDSPCWEKTTTGYSYRADVTTLVSGNGSYRLTNFASGLRNGADPFAGTPVPPLAEGASLVVVYAKSTYPLTTVVIANGYSLVKDSTGLAATLPFGFSATTPVGQVRSTFIGADGQRNFAKPASTINGVAVPGADWRGSDPPTPAYSQGNLWDTDTVNAVNLVRPGNLSARVTVAGGPDCVVWVAQVLSIGRFGAADTDGDKLLDGWEANGYDAGNDGVIDVNLPKFGASVVRKDLFVEMDYMAAEATCPCTLPLAADLSRIRAVFATAPQANNPNGQTGIALHLDAGPARGSAFNLGGGNRVPLDDDLNPVVAQFNAIKARNFTSVRSKIFYYMVWGENYDGDTSSGNAFTIPNDSFVVTLGSWASHGTSNDKVGTFVHEFGHALGQKHGGDDHANFEPNYLSVMNYAFQTTGVPRTGGRPAYFGYSSFLVPRLDERRLVERVGLNSAAANTYRTRWFCPDGRQSTSPGTANGPLDWNCNGRLSGTVSVDLNQDDTKTTLAGHNNWGHLVYGGGKIGADPAPGVSVTRPGPHELTWDERQHLAR